MPQQVPLRPGDPRRLGRYRLGGRIEGIPSEDPVFIGLGPDGREVAISLLRGDWAHDAAARDRFAAEAAVAKRVPPFCAARVLDAGLEEDDAYLVSEYVPGPSLLDLVAADGVRDGEDLDAVAIAMATGLASVHQAGLVHGNFGPEYVVLAPDGPPRVIEYGITPPYGSATPSADMLAWAQTVVFAATGRPPSRLDDLDVLPEHIRRPVEQCLDADPAERPAARAVVLELLGDAELPGGLLAEASRRAARSFSRAQRLAPARLPRGSSRLGTTRCRDQRTITGATVHHPSRPEVARVLVAACLPNMAQSVLAQPALAVLVTMELAAVAAGARSG
jgi:serine/threonine protein kinase